MNTTHDKNPSNLVSVTLNKRRIPLLIDSGSCVSCVSHDFALKIRAKITPVSERVPERLLTANCVPLTVVWQTEATVGLRGLLVPHVFVVIRDLNHKTFVGMGFLQETGCKHDLKAKVGPFFDNLVILPVFGNHRIKRFC